MNSTTIILLIGTGLLVAGLAVSGFSVFSVAKQVLSGAALVNGTSLQPGMAIGAVMKNVPAGQQLAFSISENPANVPLKIRVIGPDGNSIATYDNITGNTFATRSIETSVAGDQTLEITNVGSGPVVVTGILINSPIGHLQASNTQLQSFVSYGIAILGGIALVIAGIVMLIIGAVMYFKGRRHAPNPMGPPT